jgi:hypothetical protein
MKSSFIAYLFAALIAYVAASPRGLAQASAVTDIGTIEGSTGRVDTTWLGNTKASALYTLVYSASGFAGQSNPGVPPSGMPHPSTAVTGVGTTYSLYQNTTANLYYIRKRVTGSAGGCGGSEVYYWSEMYFSGHLINLPPYATEFSTTSSALRLGQQATIKATVKDDGNLVEVRLKYLPPGPSSVWIEGSTAAGTLWAGTGGGGGAGITLTLTRNYALLGTWKFELAANDTRAGNVLGIKSDLIQVGATAYYDSGNAYGTTYPALINSSGAGSVVRAGQTALVPVEFTITGAGTGKPVRVSVGAGGGKLFTTSTPAGPGADFLELTTNANGKVLAYYQVGAKPGGLAGIYALAGLSFAKLELTTGLPTSALPGDASGLIDSDSDGMSDKLETAINGGTSVNYTSTSPLAGFILLNP